MGSTPAKEHLLKGQAQYDWTPNWFIENITYLFTEEATLMKR